MPLRHLLLLAPLVAAAASENAVSFRHLAGPPDNSFAVEAIDVVPGGAGPFRCAAACSLTEECLAFETGSGSGCTRLREHQDVNLDPVAVPGRLMVRSGAEDRVRGDAPGDPGPQEPPVTTE